MSCCSARGREQSLHWQADKNATGHNGISGHAQVREYFEKSYEETEGTNTVKLAVKALMEVVEAGSKNLEIAAMEKDTGEKLILVCTIFGMRPRQRG